MPDRLCAAVRKRDGKISTKQIESQFLLGPASPSTSAPVDVFWKQEACGDVYQVGSQRKGTESELGSYLWVLLALLWVPGIQMIFFFSSFKRGTADQNIDEADTEKHN